MVVGGGEVNKVGKLAQFSYAKAYHISWHYVTAANSKHQNFLELLFFARMERSQGHFEWSGEEPGRFPKILPEDCIEYAIYIIDAKLSDFQVKEQLRQVQKAGIKLAKDLLKDYIWQREPIQFHLVLEKGKLPQFVSIVG